MIVLFENKGVLPVEAIEIAGLSVKTGDNPIGYFGTGLKYAIAVLLRERQRVVIVTGGERHVFTTKDISVKDRSFERIYRNDQPMGFTTEYGKTWQLWQALRELYCNTIDEGGTHQILDQEPRTFDPGRTYVIVEGDKFVETYHHRESVILESQPLFVGALAKIHRHPFGKDSSTEVFYRGIRAGQMEHPSIFCWNITDKLDLTEDRTIKVAFYAKAAIAVTVMKLTDRELLKKILTADRDTMEGQLNFELSNPDETFLDVVAELRQDPAAKLNLSALKCYCRVRKIGLISKESVTLDTFGQHELRRQIEVCKKMGYAVDDFQIVIKDYLGDNIYALAHDKTIFLSRQLVDIGGRKLAHGLIEEFVHLRYGFEDETRELQSWLFEQLVLMGERYLAAEHSLHGVQDDSFPVKLAS